MFQVYVGGVGAWVRVLRDWVLVMHYALVTQYHCPSVKQYLHFV